MKVYETNYTEMKTERVTKQSFDSALPTNLHFPCARPTSDARLPIGVFIAFRATLNAAIN